MFAVAPTTELCRLPVISSLIALSGCGSDTASTDPAVTPGAETSTGATAEAEPEGRGPLGSTPAPSVLTSWTETSGYYVQAFTYAPNDQQVETSYPPTLCTVSPDMSPCTATPSTPGASCSLSPGITGIVAAGNTSTCRTSGLSVPVMADQWAVLVVRTQVTADLDAATAAVGYWSAGVKLS